MPPSMNPSPQQLARSAYHEVMARVLHMALPWAVYLLFTFLANIARLMAWRYHYLGVTAFIVLLLGACVAVLDWHLRTSRLRAVARWIGPVTTGAGTLMFFVFLMKGYDRLLVDVWVFGGVTACLGWDLWMHAAQHDLTRAFQQAAQASGITAQLQPARQPRQLPAGQPQRRRAMTGQVVLDGATPAELAEQVDRIEGGIGAAPGSFTFRPNAGHAAVADYTVSDPGTLDRSLPWPGPSRPGGSAADPFRMGLFQDEGLLDVLMVPAFNDMASGGTGSGKTTSYLWNRLAEGVTRRDYACFAVDITKLRQFLGPVAEGLHGMAVTEEQMLALLEALERARKARLDYLARRNMTLWTKGCGLTFLDTDLQECPDIFAILEKLERISRNKPGSPYTIETWKTGVKAGRSSGMATHASLQLGHNTEMPTVARSNLLGRVTFGLAARSEAAIALTVRQVEARCRPELWGASVPGKAYVDLPTMDPADVATPARFWDWDPERTGTGDRISAYMSEWRAADRPLDEITGEAMANVPAAPPSYGLPAPGGKLPGRVAPRNVTPLFPAGAPQQQPTAGQQKDAATLAAVGALRALLAGWLADGHDTFTVMEVRATGILAEHDRSRTWINLTVAGFITRGWVRELPGGPNTSAKTWKILPAIANGLEQQEEA